MRMGRLAVHAGPSMWVDGRWHLLNGRRYPPVMTGVGPSGPVMGRGVVLGIGPWMLWVTVDLRDSQQPPRPRRWPQPEGS